MIAFPIRVQILLAVRRDRIVWGDARHWNIEFTKDKSAGKTISYCEQRCDRTGKVTQGLLVMRHARRKVTNSAPTGITIHG